MPEIQAVCAKLSEKVALILAEYTPVIISPKRFKSDQRDTNNSTADITDIDPLLQKDTNILIAGNIGIDNKTGKYTNINADNIAGTIALSVDNVSKVFFIGKTNGILADDKITTIPEIEPESIDSQKYKDGMCPKIEIAKTIAQAGIPVHLVSWNYPGDIVRDSFIPTGIPERATMISKLKNPEEFVTLKKDNLLLTQLQTLLSLNPLILPRTKDELLQNIENWIILLQDRVIKGTCEIKKHASNSEIYELGAFAVPCFLHNKGLGKKIFEQFELKRKEEGILKGCAIIKSENKKAFSFFSKNGKQKPFPSWFPKERKKEERIYFEWE